MTNTIDAIHFQELANLNPEEVCQRTSCHYDYSNKYFLLPVWNYEFNVYPDQLKIDCAGSSEPHEYFSLFAVHYLLKAKSVEISGNWISEKDIPGGPTFFRGPHEIPTALISNRFENDVSDFKGSCEQLNGVPLNMADVAYRFEITPRVPVAVLYWTGDDDFPPESKLLYDQTITEHLALDIVYALAVGICESLGGAN
jgi:hypothetical protein